MEQARAGGGAGCRGERSLLGQTPTLDAGEHGVKGTGSKAWRQGHGVKGKHEGSQCTSVLARSFPGPGRDPLHVSAGLVTCGLPAMPRAALRILSCH